MNKFEVTTEKPKNTPRPEKERFESLLAYFTDIWKGSQVPISTKELFKTNVKNDKGKLLSLAQKNGVTTPYPPELLEECGIIKITDKDMERWCFILWCWEGPPTMETVKVVEETRLAKLKAKTKAENNVDEIIADLGDSVIDKYIVANLDTDKNFNNGKGFKGYNPQDENVKKHYTVLLTMEKNTQNEYRLEDGLFMDTVLNEGTEKYEAVDLFESLKADTRFNQAFRLMWGIEELHPENPKLSRYCHESPVTTNLVRKILFIMYKDKHKQIDIIEPIVEQEVAEVDVPVVNDAMKKVIEGIIDAALEKQFTKQNSALLDELKLMIESIDVEAFVDSLGDDYQKKIKPLGAISEKHINVSLELIDNMKQLIELLTKNNITSTDR